MASKHITNTSNYFIHSDGFCFKQKGRIRNEIPCVIVKGIPRVKIEHRKLNLARLMVQYFIKSDLSVEDVIDYEIIHGRIPLDKIRLKRVKKYSQDKPEELLHYWNCIRKANSANTRDGLNNIAPEDVYAALLRTNFHCTYCNAKLKNTDWQLDHVVPISKGGVTSVMNITPACKVCNMMKGSLPLQQFILWCERITKHYSQNK